MRLRFLAWMFAIGAMALGAARSQDFPSKPIRFVTAAPSGSSDFTARPNHAAFSTRLSF